MSALVYYLFSFCSVLVSAKILLMFLLKTGMVLCSGFRMRTILIILQCFSCCWAVFIVSQRLFSFPYCLTSKEVRYAKTEKGQGSCSKMNESHYMLSWWTTKLREANQRLGLRTTGSGEQLLCTSLFQYILLLLLLHLLLLLLLSFLSY